MCNKARLVDVAIYLRFTWVSHDTSAELGAVGFPRGRGAVDLWAKLLLALKEILILGLRVKYDVRVVDSLGHELLIDFV